jgi:lipopolysaccharide transport system ATP-binding protein
MSNQTIIKVEGLSKHYLLNKNPMQKSDTLYGNFINGLKNIKQLTQKKQTEDFWALKDVSFEIEQGDRVGIIGRNGAGKSTLLKILSRITPPTKGRIEYSGRMASLLEVGTGFHGDLSGRENIYLNGSILGMTKHEIDRKFDEIVAFAEIEKFLDTPVKRYSSGMYVRLAFAVAANLESDILIVDEVLAVGDAAFQKKCLGKMNEVSKSDGKTILFVSHQLNTLQALCNKGLVLSKGEVSLNLSSSEQAIKHYMLLANQTARTAIYDRLDREGEGKIKVTDIKFSNSNKQDIEELITGQQLFIHISYQCINTFIGQKISIALAFYGDDGILYTVLNSENTGVVYDNVKGSGELVCSINKLPLMEGNYFINVSINENGITQDWVQEATTISVIAGDFYGTGKINPTSHKSILIDNTWLKK